MLGDHIQIQTHNALRAHRHILVFFTVDLRMNSTCQNFFFTDLSRYVLLDVSKIYS
jgi:hypothetical protein